MPKQRVPAPVIAVVLALLSLVALAARTDRIDDYVQTRMKEFSVPSVSMAIVENGKIVKIGSYGLADVARGTKAAPETVYKIGSVSKQLIATGIMLLVQDGRLKVDDPVSRHLEGTPPSWAPITIRHLLSHTSGIVRESPAFDPHKVKSDAEVIKAAYAEPLRFPTGTKWEYCNVGYFALAEIITRVSGKPWTQFMDERVFKPAGMTATAPTNITPKLPHSALGYDGKDNQKLADDWVALRPSGAFLSTVEDLAKWDAVLYTEKVLTEASRREMWTAARLNDGTATSYGFGWRVQTTESGRQLVQHGGSLPGFTSHMTRFLNEKVTVILLSNAGDIDAGGIANGIADLYLTDKGQKTAQPTPARGNMR